MIDLQIRRARREDVATILRFFAEDDFGGARELALPARAREQGALRAFEEIDSDSRQLLWVAEQDDHVVGTLQLTFLRYLSHGGEGAALIESVHVDRKARSKGVGTQLMRAAIDEARRRGCNRVQLTSNVARKDAHRFYERLGFTPTHAGFKLYL